MIDALANKYAEAINNNDAAAIAAFYTEDAVFVTSGGPKYGRDAIKKFYADLFQQFHFSNYTSKADQYSPAEQSMGTARHDEPRSTLAKARPPRRSFQGAQHNERHLH